MVISTPPGARATGNGTQNSLSFVSSQPDTYKADIEARISDTCIDCIAWMMMLDGDDDLLTVSEVTVFVKTDDDNRMFSQSGPPSDFERLLFNVIKDFITSEVGGEWLAEKLQTMGWSSTIIKKMNAIGLVVAFIASRYRWNGLVLDGLDLEISEPDLPILLRQSTTLVGDTDTYIDVLVRYISHPHLSMDIFNGPGRAGDAVHAIWAAVRERVTPSPGAIQPVSPQVNHTTTAPAIGSGSPGGALEKRGPGRPRKNTSTPTAGNKAKRGRPRKNQSSGPAAAAKKRTAARRDTSDLEDMATVLMSIGSDAIQAPPVHVVAHIDPNLAVQLVELIARFWQTTAEIVVKSMLKGDDSVAAILAGLMRLDPRDVADVVASVVIGYNGEVIKKRISAAYQ
jgi:hypothetical protein